MADYVLVDMFAEAVTGQRTTDDARERAESAPTATTGRDAREGAVPSAAASARHRAVPAGDSAQPDAHDGRHAQADDASPFGAVAAQPRAATASGSSSCCRRRSSCSASSPTRSASASGSASPTPGSAARASSSGSRTTSCCPTTASSGSSVFNTLLYTVVASVLKFGLGLWLALLLNENAAVQGLLPRHRAAALGGADRALGAGLLVDLRQPVLDHLLGADRSGADRRADQLPRRAAATPAPR